jgi:hypothetical protein
VDKNHTDPTTMPLWGVENTGWNFSQISPLWGLISPEYENHPNVSSVRKASLYLPGGTDLEYRAGYSTSYQNMPGTDFYRPAMYTVYGSGVTVLG